MAALDINHSAFPPIKGVTKKPPRHYRLSIKSFSTLKSKEKYESREFKAGGYKWKLVLFPYGNKDRGVKDHISLYLELGETQTIKPGKIVTIDYKLFLLNRHKGKESYLVLQDSNKEEKKYCIHKTIVGGLAGFDRFIPLKEFSDASNGYLIDDSCEFGVEVMVYETTRKSKVECFIDNLNIAMCKYVWKVTNFSKLNATFYYSKPLDGVNQKYCAWRLKIFPKGNETGEGSHVSLYLGLHNPQHLPPGSRILAEITLRILDQIHGNHRSFPAEAAWFDSTVDNVYKGCAKMITQEENARFSKDDNCIIEVEVTIQGLSIPRIGHGVFKLFN